MPTQVLQRAQSISASQVTEEREIDGTVSFREDGLIDEIAMAWPNGSASTEETYYKFKEPIEGDSQYQQIMTAHTYNCHGGKVNLGEYKVGILGNKILINSLSENSSDKVVVVRWQPGSNNQLELVSSVVEKA